MRVQSGCRLPILCCNILGRATGHSNMVQMRCMADNESMGKKKKTELHRFYFLNIVIKCCQPRLSSRAWFGMECNQ